MRGSWAIAGLPRWADGDCLDGDAGAHEQRGAQQLRGHEQLAERHRGEQCGGEGFAQRQHGGAGCSDASQASQEQQGAAAPASAPSVTSSPVSRRSLTGASTVAGRAVTASAPSPAAAVAARRLTAVRPVVALAGIAAPEAFWELCRDELRSYLEPWRQPGL